MADFDGGNDNLKFLKSHASEFRHRVWASALLRSGISDTGLAKALSDRFRKIKNTKHVVFSDTIECLEKLRNQYALGLITNGVPDVQPDFEIKGLIELYEIV